MKFIFRFPKQDRVETVVVLRNSELLDSTPIEKQEKQKEIVEKFESLLKKYDDVFKEFPPTQPISLGDVKFESWEKGKKYVEEFKDVEVQYSRAYKRMILSGGKNTEQGLEYFLVRYKNEEGEIMKHELDLDKSEKEYKDAYFKKYGKKFNYQELEKRNRLIGAEEVIFDGVRNIRQKRRNLSYWNRAAKNKYETSYRDVEFESLRDQKPQSGISGKKIEKQRDLNFLEKFLKPTEQLLEKKNTGNDLGNLKGEITGTHS